MTPPQRVSFPVHSSLRRHVDAVVVKCSPEFPSPRLEVVKRLAPCYAKALLRSALHPLSALWNAIFIFVVHSRSLSSCLVSRINVFKVVVFHHSVSRRLARACTGRQNLLQKLEVPQFCLVREFDIELNVEIAEVVVSEGGHTLAFDNLDGACIPSVFISAEVRYDVLTRRDWISREDVDSQPSLIKMLNVDGTTSKSCE